jgi:hypothetical protein
MVTYKIGRYRFFWMHKRLTIYYHHFSGEVFYPNGRGIFEQLRTIRRKNLEYEQNTNM